MNDSNNNKRSRDERAEMSWEAVEIFGFVNPVVQEEIAESGKLTMPLYLVPRLKTMEDKREKKEKLHRESQYKKQAGSKKSRDIHLFDIPKENCIYDQFIPLHKLWSQYIAEVAGSIKGQMLVAKLIKADLHGAIIRVVRSMCPSYIGQKGIVIQETENTFKMIMTNNKVNVIPKANSVFQLNWMNMEIEIYGDHFCYRGSERAIRKFKPKKTIEVG
ncbi:hypothetical protein SAMD00019534_064510 [Acytostelium subglobosum LB1]|uniref:hypothetical protein n=1 Tax=Acytostelium subglobosum LB1 TaxID=1410327 RepID=UPI000644CB79|nr:hypothetical protein SAMD00019534_064510 [Acytostelium subglobosum LB1]GAM23276.1 hypothetical protein SAMD00019534_064510 [Acytostelium subglobosum LB1]|eukprot:XP_012753725.1 hypothetical protein SAMD00019534_064510 [Acytostelium subglobosum LB1]